MQSRTFVYFIFFITLTDGLFFDSKPKCSIKKYKSNKYFLGESLLLHENFHDRVKPLETLAKQCQIRLYIKGSYYQLANPSQQVSISDADLVIGHGFRFEIRDENNAVLCNKICLNKNPADISQVKCFLQGAVNHGLTWSSTNTDVLSDGTYAANTAGYQTLKTDIQTPCQQEKFKREFFQLFRRMYEEQ